MESHEDLKRIENKVDKLTDAVTRLILVEERQTAQARRLTDLEINMGYFEKDLHVLDKKVDKWISMGTGAWAVVVTVFAVIQLLVKL